MQGMPTLAATGNCHPQRPVHGAIWKKKVIQQNEEWTNMYVCMYVLRPPGQQIPSQDPDSFPIR